MPERPENSIAPPRSLSGASTSDDDRSGVVLPPLPEEEPKTGGFGSWLKRSDKDDQEGGTGVETKQSPTPNPVLPKPAGRAAAPRPHTRKATLRLVQVEPWSVMKAAFLLSVALGIVTIVAVAVVWGVLGAAGLWDSVNSIVRDSIGDNSGTPFEIQKYLGTSRVLGFTMIVAVFDIVLITAIATLGAFLYNLAATLLGGVEVTFAEDR